MLGTADTARTTCRCGCSRTLKRLDREPIGVHSGRIAKGLVQFVTARNGQLVRGLVRGVSQNEQLRGEELEGQLRTGNKLADSSRCRTESEIGLSDAE